MKHAAPLPLLAAALALSACVTEEPTGPPIAILTVSADLPLDAGALAPDAEAAATGARAGRGDWELLAAHLCAEPPAAPDSDSPSLGGAAATLAERALIAGFETAAFVTGDATREENGLLQGHFHGFDGPSLATMIPESPVELATQLAAEFVADKAPRPMEDASFVWLHLDLGGLEPAAAAALAGDAWERLRAAHGDRADALRVLYLLPTADAPGALASTAGAPSPDATLYSLVADRAGLLPIDAEFPLRETCATHYPSGELWSVRLYKEGRPDRPWIGWYPNEFPKYERTYDVGARTGRWISRAPTAHLLFERHYEADEPHGEWIRRDLAETVIERGSFERGMRVGPWRTWHTNGQLASERTFAAGLPTGPLQRWDEAGVAIESTP